MPPSHQYRQRDYEFANTFVTLRTAIGLTQQGLAALLGVSSRAVENWEQGLTNPKAEYLKAFLELCVRAAAFAAGREEEQIRAFWRAAHQKVLLDEYWLQELLARPSPAPAGVAGEQSSAAEQGSAAASNELALWTVPFARNPHFTGRDELLEQLTAQLAPPASGQPGPLRRAALMQAQIIKGLGGIGKTQTAVEYAYRAREQGRYAHTLWIAAATEEALLASFAALAELLPGMTLAGETDQRKLVAAVLRWLEQCPEPWLLIVDNADDLTMAQPYLPLRGNGSVLLTTRASATGWLAPSLEVDAMGVLEGAELLLRRAQRFASATDEEINEAANLVVALAQFPLALDQAGAYIEETGCSLADYLQLYQTHRLALLARRGRQASQYPASVATTWELSFEHVAQTNPTAADLLRLCAFLAPDHIPEELLTGGAPQWPTALQEAVADRFSFNQLLENLLAFSLVKRLSEERQLSIHRLVQAVQRERLEAVEQRQWAERLVRAMGAVFPREPQETASWAQCSRYLEQVQACDLLIQEQVLLLPEAAEVLERTGTYLRERALYSLAEPLYRHALSIWEQQAKPDPMSRARCLNHLALLSFEVDKSAQAEALYQQALAMREQHLGPEHLDVAGSVHDLADLYYKLGKYTQAEPLYLRALAMREQHLGPEHLDVAASLNGLANLYERQGNYAQAESLTRRALSIREQQLGPEHLDVAESLNDLALVYSSMKGKHAQAEPLYLRTLRICEQHLGLEHPLVAYPLRGLALLYQEQGEYAKAEPLFVRALAIRERQFDPHHRNLASLLINLADVYREQGKYAEAELLYLRALRIREQQLGQDHPQVAFALDGLAHLYGMQEKFTEAVALYQRSLRIRQRQLGQEHRDVAVSLNGLANLYTRQGKFAQAEPLYQRALRISEQQVEHEQLETATLLHDFATFQRAQGQTSEAVRFYQRALTIRENVLGADYPVTTDTRERLHKVLVALGQTHEAALVEAPPREKHPLRGTR